MKFTVLGSGTAFPTADRGPAGFLLQVASAAYLIDGGSGTLQKCARAGVPPIALSGGFLSHAHPDHCADLVPLLFSYRVAHRTTPYPLFGTAEVQQKVRATQAVHGKWLRFPGGLTQTTVTPPEQVRLPSGLHATARRAQHSAGAVHWGFDEGDARVVYSGDTGPSQALIELAAGADLLICECAGTDAEPIKGHLWPSAVADIAAAARPKQIWLTHLYPDVDPVLAVETVAATGVLCRHAKDFDSWSSTDRIP